MVERNPRHGRREARSAPDGGADADTVLATLAVLCVLGIAFLVLALFDFCVELLATALAMGGAS